MKKIAVLEILIGILTLAGAFIVGNSAIAALILALFIPGMSKKIDIEKIDLVKYYKLNNLFFPVLILIIIIINSIIAKNHSLNSLWMPLITSVLLLIKGFMDFVISEKKQA
jgi:hypothetical protein